MPIFEKGLKNEKILKACGIIACFGMIAVILISSVDYHAFNKDYYRSEYAKLNTAEELGMSEEGLFDATFALLDYIHLERDNIVSISEVKGQQREVFNERETLHMKDVKDLYQNVLTARTVLLILGIVSFLFMIYSYQKQKRSWRDLLADLATSYLQVSFCLGVLAFALIAWAVMDFTSFWIGFHQLFFTNDLWQLNPATSLMINMFPEVFFAGMVFRIIITFVLFYGSILGIVLFYRKKRYHMLTQKN